MATAKKWTGKVKVKWHSPPGLFTESAEKIAKVVAENAKSLKQTISRIQFYATRAGVNIDASGKAKIERAKKLAHQYFPEKKKAKSAWKPKPARAPKRKTSLSVPTKKRAPKKRAATSLSRELPPARPLANHPYWFIGEAWTPMKWRRSRRGYSHTGRKTLRYHTTQAMPTLGKGMFHVWSVLVDKHIARVAQRA